MLGNCKLHPPPIIQLVYQSKTLKGKFSLIPRFLNLINKKQSYDNMIIMIIFSSCTRLHNVVQVCSSWKPENENCRDASHLIDMAQTLRIIFDIFYPASLFLRFVALDDGDFESETFQINSDIAF